MIDTVRVPLITLAILTCISGVGAQELPVAPSVDYLYRQGIQLTLDSTTDSLLVTGSDHADGTAETWLEFGADVRLGKLSPKLAHARAFFSLHANGNWNSGFGGAVQSISGIQSHAGLRAAEIWVEQTIASGVRVRAGKIDGNRDFAYVENASSFVNTAWGYTPSFSLLPNYNSTERGAELLIESKGTRLNLAGFQNPNGTGSLLVGEAGRHWSARDLTGRLAVGGWQSTGTNFALDGSVEPRVRGGYVIAEQTLWHAASPGGKSVAAFFQWGSAPSHFSSFVQHTGAGILLKTPLAKRSADSVALGFSRGRLNPLTSGLACSHESVWETVYRARISSRLSISPDIQYIAHPGGAGRDLIAFGARVNVSLLQHRE